MKKITEKIICVLLALLMISSVSVFASAEVQEEYPTVYIHGLGPDLTSVNGKTVYPVTVDANKLVKDNIQALLESIVLGEVTRDWEDCAELLLSIVEDIFSPMYFDGDGEPVNYVGPMNNLSKISTKKSGYGLSDYSFHYDWREDPVKIADELNDYINAVLAATEKEKVNIVAFSMGGCTALAYLAKYGNEKIDTLVLHSSAHNGVIACGAPMAGKIDFNADSIERYFDYYLKTNSLFGDEALDELFGTLVILLEKVNTVGLASDVLERFYNNLSELVMPNLGLASVGTMPGIWSIISEEYYDDAKALAFSDKGDKYDGLIEKIDYYHNNVKLKADSLLEEANQNGTKVCIVAKYGIPLIPLFDGCNSVGDGVIALGDQSLGATCAANDGVLSDKYISVAKAAGTDKYISADKKVDASTCLFPDSTWFIKGVEHSNGGEFADTIIRELINKPSQPTVNDDDTPEQFNFANEETGKLEPVTEEAEKKSDSFFKVLFQFFTLLVKFAFSSIQK